MAPVLAGTSASLRALVAMIAATACALVALSGCGTARTQGSGATVITVTERDFHIASSLARVGAGTVTLRVHNNGPDQHELIVMPERAGGLPIRSDGFTVDEDAIARSEPGSLDPGQSGSTRDLTVSMKPGRYLLFCNMEGHYMAGMRTELVVG